MALVTWPPGLPVAPQRQGYSESLGVSVIRTPMDQGPAKMRYKGRRPDPMTLSFIMTSSQVLILDTFVKVTLMGVRRFDFLHPRTGALVEARFVAEQDGAYYELQRLNVDLWEVKMKFEILP